MIVEFILLELLVGAMLLGFMGSFKKRMADRIILFLTIPVSFFGAMWLSKSEYYGELTDFVMEQIPTESLSPSVVSTVEALIATLARPIAVVLLFWVLLFAFRIAVGIIMTIVHLILRTRKKEKARGKKRSRTNKLVTGTLGVLSGFIVCMLSFLPLVYINDLTEPAVKTALSEEYDGTYVNEVAAELDTVGMPFSEGTVLSKVTEYSGMRAFFDVTLANMTDATVTMESGKEVSFNSLELVRLFTTEGVRALAVYETTCDSDASLGDLAPAGAILKALSENDLLVALGTDLLTGLEVAEPTDESSVTDQLLHFLATEYGTGDTEVIKQDVNALTALMDLVTTDLAYVGLEQDEWLPALLDYMQNEEYAEKMVATVAMTNIYDKGFPVFMEFGLELIAEAMDLSDNKADDYQSYLSSLTAVMNDKTVAIYDTKGVDTFIKYCADNSVKVSEYGITDSDSLTDLDIAYTSYLSFFARMEFAEEVFTDYLITDGSGVITYVTADGSSIYVYDEATTAWTYYADETVNAASAVGGLLVNAANDIIAKNADAIITGEDIVALARSYMSVFASTDDVTTGGIATVLRSISNETYFSPDAVYADDVVGALNKDAKLDDEHNKEFSKALSIMAGIYGEVTDEGGEASIDTIMNHFGDIGRMLDCFARMKSTEKVPEKMLAAIMNNKNYSVYFDSDAVHRLIENVKNGESTYEELFNYVQAIYNIASGIMPG